jgi:hypothetical protein
MKPLLAAVLLIALGLLCLFALPKSASDEANEYGPSCPLLDTSIDA